MDSARGAGERSPHVAPCSSFGDWREHPLKFFLTALVVLTLTPAAYAGGLAPRKPSDLRTVMTSGSACPSPVSSAAALDTQQNPDGTNSAFSIPAGSVFVVTSADIKLGGVTAGSAVGGFFLAVNGGNASTLSGCGGNAGTNGTFFVSCTFPDGVTVKSWTTLCFNSQGVVGFELILAHGFITKDK